VSLTPTRCEEGGEGGVTVSREPTELARALWPGVSSAKLKRGKKRTVLANPHCVELWDRCSASRAPLRVPDKPQNFRIVRVRRTTSPVQRALPPRFTGRCVTTSSRAHGGDAAFAGASDHHIEPWSVNFRRVGNIHCLCAACHCQKTRRERLLLLEQEEVARGVAKESL